MKKLFFALLLVSCTSPALFAQTSWGEIYQDTLIKRELNRQLERAQIDEIHALLSPKIEKIYKKLPLSEQVAVDMVFLKAAQAKHEIHIYNFPSKYRRTDLELFVSGLEDLYNTHLLYRPKTTVSLIITSALYQLEFETKDEVVFKIRDFLEDYTEAFENLEPLTQGKLAIWRAQITLDELELKL